MIRIGIDLGGTKIEGLALDREGNELCRKRVATPRGSYQEIVDAVVQLIRMVEEACGERGSIGLGIPGIASPATGLIKNANTTLLNGHPLDKDLEHPHTRRMGQGSKQLRLHLRERYRRTRQLLPLLWHLTRLSNC